MDQDVNHLPYPIVAYTCFCATRLQLGVSAIHASLALFIRLDGRLVAASDPKSVQLLQFAIIDLVAKHLYRIPLPLAKLQECHQDSLTQDSFYKYEAQVLDLVNFQVWHEGTISDWLCKILETCQSLLSDRIKPLFMQTVNSLACLIWCWDGPSRVTSSRTLAAIVIQASISLLVQAKVRNCLFLRETLQTLNLPDLNPQLSRDFLRFIHN
jgi:hypothetical protein